MICRTCAQRVLRPSGFVARISSRIPASERSYSLLTSFSRLSLQNGRSAFPPTTPSASRPTLAQAEQAIQITTADRSAAFSTTAPVFGPRDTYQMTHKKRKRKFGFLARLKSRTGRKILTRRRAKGRQNMSH